MPLRSLKDFLQKLDAQGQVHRIDTKVDPNWEVGAIARENHDRHGPALIFNKVGDHRTPLVLGVLASRERYAMALEVKPSINEIREKWRNAYGNPVEQKVVSDSKAPVKEVRLKEIDLYQDPFPVPIWHELNTERGIATLSAVITIDPDTGWINVGNYLGMIAGKDKISLTINRLRHARLHLEKWKRKGAKSMPVAIALGLDPVLSMVAVSGLPADVNDYGIAGGLRGSPIEVVKAETSDLLVPAHAEIVIEGEMPTDKLVDRGPWGDFTGHMLAPEKAEYIEVRAITCQQDAYYQGTLEGRPPNESTTIRSIGRSLALYEHLKNSRITNVKDVCITTGGCGQFHAVVAVKKGLPGLVTDVLLSVLGNRTVFVKKCMVVDEDVDPWDSQSVEYAEALNVKASRDIQIFRNGKGMPQDLSDVILTSRNLGETDYVGIDATRKPEIWKASGAEYPHTADPPAEWVKRVREKWTEYGLR